MADNFRDSFLYDPNFHRFADFMGIDKYARDDYNISKKILFLYEWGRRKVQSDDFIDVLKAVTGLKKDIGTTTKGKTLVDDMYKWARLDYDSLRIRDEKQIQREKISKEEQQKLDRQERILDRAKKWQDQRDEPKKQSEKAEKLLDKNVSEYNKQQQKLSNKQKDADLTVDIEPAVESEPMEVEI